MCPIWMRRSRGRGNAPAWATAWSIYCKNVDPGSDHCKQPTSEYLKKEAVSKEDAEASAEVKRRVHEMTEEMLAFAEDMEKFQGKMERWLEKLPDGMLWEDIPDVLHSAISSMGTSISKLRKHAHRL